MHEIVVGTRIDSNPDDAAEANSGTGVMTPWLCIFHGQFEYTGKALASVFIPVALSCLENRIVKGFTIKVESYIFYAST